MMSIVPVAPIAVALGPGSNDMDQWKTVSQSLLRSLPHEMGALELKHKVPEVTFLGVRDQPDFAELYITMYPSKREIELRSLKEYIYAWRNVVVSYERFVDTVF